MCRYHSLYDHICSDPSLWDESAVRALEGTEIKDRKFFFISRQRDNPTLEERIRPYYTCPIILLYLPPAHQQISRCSFAQLYEKGVLHRACTSYRERYSGLTGILTEEEEEGEAGRRHQPTGGYPTGTKRLRSCPASSQDEAHV
ncbi:unnamed protein product [Pylaiella littoralis]